MATPQIGQNRPVWKQSNTEQSQFKKENFFILLTTPEGCEGFVGVRWWVWKNDALLPV